MSERRGWAEALVWAGGATLVVTYFLPLIGDWGPQADDWLSTAGLVLDCLGDIDHAQGPVDLLRGLLAMAFLSAPHAFGALVAAEAAGTLVGPRGPRRFFRVCVRCCLYFWLGASLLFPIVSGDGLEASFRTMCLVFFGLLIVIWVVIGRWWPARSHDEFMRRGRLMGSILITIWFGVILVAEDDFYPATMAASLVGALLIAAGSLPGLFRGDTGADPTPGSDEG